MDRELLVERDEKTLSVIVRDARRCQLRVRATRIERVDEARKPTEFLYIDAGLVILTIAGPMLLAANSPNGSQRQTDLLSAALIGGLTTTIILTAQVTRQHERSHFREVELGSEVYPERCGSRLAAHQRLHLVFSDGTTQELWTDERGAVQVPVAAELGVELRARGASTLRVPPWTDPGQ